MNSPDANNGWNEWSRFVLKQLESLSGNQDKLAKKDDEIIAQISAVKEEMIIKINDVQNEINLLKLKSGIWGAAAGAIPATATIIIMVAAKFI